MLLLRTINDMSFYITKRAMHVHTPSPILILVIYMKMLGKLYYSLLECTQICIPTDFR